MCGKDLTKHLLFYNEGVAGVFIREMVLRKSI